MARKLKAQSAMEYLMTYGWAILIVIIVAAALYALGVFNPATYTGQRTTGFPNLGAPTDWIYSASDGELKITLRNGLGETITISSVTANCGASQASVALETLASATVGAGSTIEYETITTQCQTSTAGSSYSYTVTAQYTTQSGSYTHTDTGTITGAAA